jgi:hypothetical protein
VIAEATKIEHADRLTAKQALFVDRYVLSLNGALAAREAGYSPKIARNQAAENMTKPHIRAAIEAKLHALKPDLNLTPEKLRARVSKIVNDESLRPDTQLKAIELAGKMTPGTFEPAAPTTQVNFFTVLAKLNAMTPAQIDAIQRTIPSTVGHTLPASDVGHALPPSTVETLPHHAPHAQEHTSPGPVIDITPTHDTPTDTTAHTTPDTDDTQPAETTRTPHATPLGVVKNTPKFVEQNQPMSHLRQEESVT